MTSGIAKMRSQVSVLGRFQTIVSRVCWGLSGARMQMIIKRARQRCPDSADRLDVADPGAHQSLHATEMFEQRTALRRPEAGHGLQHGFVVAACAALAMPGDREPMGLVADA